MDTLEAHPTLPSIGSPSPVLEEALRAALLKIDENLVTFADLFPDDTTRDNVYRSRPAHGKHHAGANVGWTTAFWTGQLWLAYELTGQARYCAAAQRHVPSFARRLEDRIDIDHHDLGFLYTLSCVTAHHLTGNDAARAAALGAADALLARYWAKPGILQAWGDLSAPENRGRIIIDCLMNLPLLHWASTQSGDERHRAAALRHAEQSARHLVRADATTYHTFYFDVEGGEPLFGRTAQGFTDDSCWARGQAWGVYGFALSHAHAPGAGFLDVARQVADYFLAHLPADRVAYWDLGFGDGSGEPRDSSASAILACGLFELAAALPPEAGERYRGAALDLVTALAEGYSTRHRPDSNALLLHGVYSKPDVAGVDEANLWGDYFYLEALVRATRAWIPYWSL